MIGLEQNFGTQHIRQEVLDFGINYLGSFSLS